MSLFLFTRDLRLQDNTTLNYLIKSNPPDVPIYLAFIFNKEQIEEYDPVSQSGNPYRSVRAINFMCEGLEDLSSKVPLNLFLTDSLTSCLNEIVETVTLKRLAYNFDITPYAKKRDHALRSWAEKRGIEVVSYGDHMLATEHLDFRTKSTDRLYTVFSHFRNRVFSDRLVRRPELIDITNHFRKLPPIASSVCVESIRSQFKIGTCGAEIHGGRTIGLRFLKALEDQGNYDETRNLMKLPTSRLSAYLKFGVLSAREVFWRIQDLFGLHHGLLSQFIWRDFYYYLLYNRPEALNASFNGNKWDADFPWRLSLSDFNQFLNGKTETLDPVALDHYHRWTRGETGVDIVDAGMRQLRQTGFMHNRARMCVAFYLTKHLHLHWKWGEHWFATQLIDYDPALNNGNWQWCASTGVDPLQYGKPRMFSFESQLTKTDPDHVYVNFWLSQVAPKSSNPPIVNFEQSRDQFLSYYRGVSPPQNPHSL